ncbi:MAG: Lon protease-like protein [Planctomycetota bacterium]
MADFPDSDPLSEMPEEPNSALVPLFPLPGVWLSPLTLLPLNIFEPRYRKMIEDLLDGPGRLVMGTIVEGQDGVEIPAIYPMAGLGEIGRHERLEDGRFNIWVMGLKRVAIEEVPSDHPYRMVSTESVVEVEPDGKEKDLLTESLRRALDGVLEKLEEEQRPPEKLLKTLSVSSLADILCASLDLDRDRRQALFAELDTAKRARMVLGEYAEIQLQGDGED